MNRLLLITFHLCVITYVSAQTSGTSNTTSTFIHPTKFYVSKPMRELPEYKPDTGSNKRKEVEEDERETTIRPAKSSFSLNLQNNYTDPIRQTAQGAQIGSIAPIANFDGLSDWYFIPPDPNGAVGDSLYAEMVNSAYAVYDKLGNQRLSPRDLEYFWHGADEGDPVILFDKFADRWFISEFQDSVAPYKVCVGVSETSDPTGKYYVWEYSLGNTDPDYPKYSIWTDGYYLTFVGFNGNPGPLIVPQQVAVLERSKMLKGDPNAGMILANLPTPPDYLGGNNSFESAPKTLDCDASALPPYGTPEYLVYFENAASKSNPAPGYSDKIVMYKLVTDTNANPETLTVSRADSIAVPAFNAYFNGIYYHYDISMPGYSNSRDSGLDALDGTFNFRAPYMRFTDHNSVVLSNTVNLGNLVAGIRWYELRQDTAPNSHWIVYDSGTFGPDDTVSRWNAAICMDIDGDIALEYSVSSSSAKKHPVYPGIRYTGRLSTDPPGQMTFAEQTVINGTCSLNPAGQGIGIDSRWGDYSELDIDPIDGLTFWGTNEYMSCPHNNYTQFKRIFSFALANGAGINEVGVIHESSLHAYQQGNYLEVMAVGIPTDDKLLLDLFDIRGRQLSGQSVVPQAGQFQAQINVSNYAKGIYFVRIGRVNFQRVVKVAVE